MQLKKKRKDYILNLIIKRVSNDLPKQMEFKKLKKGDYFCFPLEMEDKVYLKLSLSTMVCLRTNNVFSMRIEALVTVARKVRLTYTI